MSDGGVLLGVTLLGGIRGEGAIFRINTNGSGCAVLRSFNSAVEAGQTPMGKPVRGADGELYGKAMTGGSRGNGTVFKLDAAGANYTVLHEFTGSDGDGRWPMGGLARSAAGVLYGTTSLGGSEDAGTVFSLHDDGSDYTVLHSFNPDTDGSLPSGTLAWGTNGQLYGVAGAGGSNGVGAVFKLNPDGSEYTTLHQFRTNSDGWGPVGGLLQGSDGAFYGTTADGGRDRKGAVFRITRNGGAYSLLVTNRVDGSFSSNATLHVLVPQLLSSPAILSDESLQFAAGYADGWLLDAADLNRFEAQVSSNLITWETLSNSPS